MSIAKKFNPRTPQDLEDYIQVGLMAITECIMSGKYDPKQKTTYLYQRAYWRIMDFVRKQSRFNSRHVLYDFNWT